MKKVFPMLIFSLIISLSSYAQTSFNAGLRGAVSTNVGFWGINPTLEMERELSQKVYATVSLNAFFDFSADEQINIPDAQPYRVTVKEHHRRLFTDFGLNLKLVDRSIDWSLGGGGSLLIGDQSYLSTSIYNAHTSILFQTEDGWFTRAGFYLKNTVSFGEAVDLNLTVYRYDYLGEYISFGPSIRFN